MCGVLALVVISLVLVDKNGVLENLVLLAREVVKDRFDIIAHENKMEGNQKTEPPQLVVQNGHSQEVTSLALLRR